MATGTASGTGVPWVLRVLLGGVFTTVVFGGGLLRLVAVALVGVGVGVLIAWLVQRARPVRCASCRAVVRRPGPTRYHWAARTDRWLVAAPSPRRATTPRPVRR